MPLLENLAKAYNGSAIPDIMEITPGFWGTLRLSTEDNLARAKMIAANGKGPATPWEGLHASRPGF